MKNFLVIALVPLLLLAALVSLGTWKGTDWQRNLLDPIGAIGLDERLSSFSPEGSTFLKEYSGEWGRHGLILRPGEKGFASFFLPMVPGADSLTIRVWAYDYGACCVKWWPEEGRGSPVTLSEAGNLNGEIWRIEPPAGTSQVILEISGRNESSQPQVLVDRITASSSPYKPLHRWTVFLWLWGGLTGLWMGFATRRKWWLPPGGTKLWSAALVLMLVGGTLRLSLLSALNGVPLDPDVVTYLQYAERLKCFDADRGFYSASFGEREPLWIAIISLWQGWVGKGDLSVKLLTCFLSVSVVGASGILLWRILGKTHWVIGGMALVALNPSLIEESCRGLRSEAMTLCFVGFLLVTFCNKEGAFSPAKAGFLGGVWALLQSPALSIASGAWLALWLMSVAEKRVSIFPILPKGYGFPKVLLAISIALALFLPHLYGLQKRHGDWRWPSYGYARWNANMEFPDRLGTPGFPTVAEFNKSPYAGPRISYGEYLFGLHTPFQLVKYQVLGWVELTAYQALSLSSQSLKLATELSNRRFSGVITSLTPGLALGLLSGIIAMVAWIRLLADKRLWWMPAMLLWGTYYVAFLYHVRLVEPLRHTMHTYPLFVLLTIWGAQWLGYRFRISENVRHVWNRRLQKPEPV